VKDAPFTPSATRRAYEPYTPQSLGVLHAHVERPRLVRDERGARALVLRVRSSFVGDDRHLVRRVHGHAGVPVREVVVVSTT
jgi:hypothetical protein